MPNKILPGTRKELSRGGSALSTDKSELMMTANTELTVINKRIKNLAADIDRNKGRVQSGKVPQIKRGAVIGYIQSAERHLQTAIQRRNIILGDLRRLYSFELMFVERAKSMLSAEQFEMIAKAARVDVKEVSSNVSIESAE